MTNGKTKSGFEFSIDENSLNDMRVVDAIAETTDGSNPFAVSFLLKAILGEEGRDALYKHVQVEGGRVPVDKITEELTDIFQEYGKEGKNS